MASGAKEEVLVLEGGEGELVLQRPTELSSENYQDVEDWLNLMLRKLKRAIRDQKPNNDTS